MDLSISFTELLAYSDEERSKWNAWFRLQAPDVFELPFQPEGRFTTLWSILDHTFVVERRHMQRLQDRYPLPESTGIPSGNWPELWQWGTATRVELVSLAQSFPPTAVSVPKRVQLPRGWTEISPRKLLFHVLVHECRHWAQVAVVLRRAGYDVPGDHDLVFSSALD